MVYYLFKMTSINVEFKPAILLKVVESQMFKSHGRINGQSVYKKLLLVYMPKLEFDLKNPIWLH